MHKAQVGCVVEYDSLCCVSAPTNTLELLDSTQNKTLKIIGVNEQQARVDLNIPSLHHRQQVAATTVLYKMHTRLCSPDLTLMLPQPYVVRRATRTSLSVPRHGLTEPISRSYSSSRTFTHSVIHFWNGPPESVVGEINDSGTQSFKSRVYHHLISIVGDGWMTH